VENRMSKQTNAWLETTWADYRSACAALNSWGLPTQNLRWAHFSANVWSSSPT